MTQNDRVLALLRQRGDQGLNTADLMAPAVDGRKPILRLAARIFDLQQQGYRIRSVRRSNATVSYFLVGERELGRPLSEAEAPARREQASPGSVPSQEGVRLAAAVQESQEGLFDTGEFAPKPSYRDAA